MTTDDDATPTRCPIETVYNKLQAPGAFMSQSVSGMRGAE